MREHFLEGEFYWLFNGVCNFVVARVVFQKNAIFWRSQNLGCTLFHIFLKINKRYQLCDWSHHCLTLGNLNEYALRGKNPFVNWCIFGWDTDQNMWKIVKFRQKFKEFGQKFVWISKSFVQPLISLLSFKLIYQRNY